MIYDCVTLDSKARIQVVKNFLLQAKKLDTRITNKQEQLDGFKAMLCRITPAYNQNVVQSSGSQDKLGDTVSKIVDIERQINAEIDLLVDKKDEIRKTIDKVEDSDQNRVLHLLYIGKLDEETGLQHYLSWDEIAAEMNMCARNAQYIHGNALLSVAEVMEERK